MPFKPGQSGNPGGRPKNTLQSLLRDKKTLPNEIYKSVYPLLKSKNENIRLQAAEFLRDARDGKPTQSVDVAVTRSPEDIENENKRFDRLYGYLGAIVK